ncbi:MAG: hypothetical protein LAT75_12810 [Candidatus Cyclonatronum sp.]|uniref:PID-CTERM protein-sorting domain-containing protein n=1 Tax=Cyclonatronum sp. TaxID=3024185 RepID=UPI0025BD11A6|nr:hypothetical protein [Cyclonatronum sp.]MCH8487742.1 hypothetical protein [Cyclonatronum sp.]
MRKLVFAVLVFVFVLVGVVAPADGYGQDRDQQVWRDSAPVQPMNQPGPPQLPGAPTQTPIGSGLALLLAAGGAYAVKRLRQE